MQERYNKLLNDIKLQQEISELLEKYLNKGREKFSIETKLDNEKKRLNELNLKLSEVSTINNRVFHRKNYKSQKIKILNDIEKSRENVSKYSSELALLEKNYLELEERLLNLGININSSLTEENLKKLPLSVTEDGLLSINSEDFKDQTIFKIDNNRAKEIDDEEKVLIHSTGFFPQNHKILTGKDGHKLDGDGTVEITYKDFTRTIPSVSTRNTVHFIENNVVHDHMYGAFSPDYIVLDSIKYHRDQMVNEDPSDTWIRGTVLLSNEAIVMVEKSKISTLSDELKKQYTIVVYEGDRAICVQNLLKQLGYPVFEIDLGCPAHADSIDHHLEGSIKTRNQMISFFKERLIDSDNISLDEKDMILLYDLFKNAYCFYNFMIPRSCGFLNNMVTKKLCENNNIDFELFKFFINFGFIKKGEAYVTKSYDEMVHLFEKINDESFDENEFNRIINELGILNIQSVLKEEKTEEQVSVKKEELLNMSFKEINNFKHLEYASKMQKYIKDHLNSIMINPTVSFDPEGINILFWTDNHEKDKYFQTNYDINKIKEIEMGNGTTTYYLLLKLNCKDLSCNDILESVAEYVEKVTEYNESKKYS